MSFISDIRLAKERDPAARNGLEIFLTYPGLHAVWSHRFSHWLWRARLKLIARLVSQGNRFVTGIEIHPAATIGRRFFIDHGMGVVVGATSIVGDDVTLYQGVTLGGTGKDKGKRHPTLEDRVVVAAGAKVLGDITIGHDSNVGAGAVVIKSVPPNSTVVGVPGRFVVHRGREIPTTDLHHERLPDPVAEMFRHLERRLDRLDNEIGEYEGGPARGHKGS
jgi:serine O-acetyltransferase